MTYTFSVSQVELARDCQAKWGFRYLEGIKLPPHPSALKGIELHKVAEAYLRDGTPPPDNEIGRIFRAGLKFLPAVGSVSVEDELQFSTQHANWVVRRDFTYFARDSDGLVGDHKTTSNLEADYNLNERTILTNPQACLYAHPLFFDGAKDVRALWVYYRTRGTPASRAVDTYMDIHACEDTVARLDEDTIPLSRLIRERPPVADLEKNYSSCSKYGGCPHRGIRCKVSTAQLFAKKGNDPMSAILERIKKLKEEKEKAAAAAAASAPERSPEPSNPAPGGENAAPSNHSGDLSDAEAAKAAKDYLESQGRTVAAGFVNPPESAGKAALAEPPPDEGGTVGSGDPEPSNTPPEAPRKRGRPKKLSPEERASAVASAVQHANQLDAQRDAAKAAEITGPGADTKVRGAAPDHPEARDRPGDSTSPPQPERVLGPVAESFFGFPAAWSPEEPMLFLDCMPPGPYAGAYALYGLARERLQRAGVEQDYRLVEFGKGRGLLAEALREVLAEQKPAAIVAESRSPEVADCITTLAEYVGEGRIVRGLR